MRPELVVKPKTAIFGVEEDGVEGGDFVLADELAGGRPDAVVTLRAPDGDVGFALGGASEPGGEEVAVAEFGEGVGVGGGEWSGDEDVLLLSVGRDGFRRDRERHDRKNGWENGEENGQGTAQTEGAVRAYSHFARMVLDLKCNCRQFWIN
jgi:hypothetical protein